MSRCRSAVVQRAHASGRTFAAYCYNADAENRWLLGSARRFAGLPGVPAVDEIEEFIGSPEWVDVFALVSDWFLCAHGKGLKVVAPVAGFAWRDAEAGEPDLLSGRVDDGIAVARIRP